MNYSNTTANCFKERTLAFNSCWLYKRAWRESLLCGNFIPDANSVWHPLLSWWSISKVRIDIREQKKKVKVYIHLLINKKVLTSVRDAGMLGSDENLYRSLYDMILQGISNTAYHIFWLLSYQDEQVTWVMPRIIIFNKSFLCCHREIHTGEISSLVSQTSADCLYTAETKKWNIFQGS